MAIDNPSSTATLVSKETENIAQTLARELPQASIVHVAEDTPEVLHIAVPRGQELRMVDLEKLLAAPRRTKCNAVLSTAESFTDYALRHAIDASMVWCRFDPQTYALDFTAVIDEHNKYESGWREHTATFKPDMSAEWKQWKAQNGKVLSQVEFAEWLESHADDITTAEGLPTSMDMLKMATEFVATQENALKSAVRLQSGGVNLTYIADPDKGTTESMKMFERFGIGIPVFHGGAAWQITCRLKYRLSAGKVHFFYDMVRPDIVHKAASLELIGQVRTALGAVPMLMGSCA